MAPRTERPRIVAVCSRKGGTGKTSLAVNLAAALAGPRRRVAVLDLDPQGSASRWAEWAEGGLPFPVHGFDTDRGPAAFRAALERLAGEVDVLILDTPPELDTPTRLALLAADLALIPVGPSALDLFAAQDAVAVAREARAARGGELPAVALVPSRLISRTREAGELPATLKSLGEPVAPAIGHRIEVARASIEGRAVRPSSTAGQEFERLAAYVRNRLRRIR